VAPPLTTSDDKQAKVAALALAALIATSAVLRSLLAFQAATPRYVPDEYIYAALGRSIAHGHIAIRGVTAHFPALLEPILAAPAWALFSTATAYHLVQIENAAAASLTCIPVYLLARHVGLGRRYSFGCGVYSVAIPALAYASSTIADALAYPLAATAILAAAKSLDRPLPRRQAAFVAWAALASFARLEYLSVIAAYVAAAIFIERRRVIRAHWVVAAVLSPAVVAALALGPSRILGYYSNVLSQHLGSSVARWFLKNIYLLVLQAGGILVPGALVAIMRPRERRARAFVTLFSALSVVLLLEAAVYSAQGPGLFKGRYLFVLLPLVPIAFGLYLERGRPLRVVVLAISALIAVAAVRVPISTFASSTLRDSSSFLLGVGYVQDHAGVGAASILVLAAVTVGAIGAAVVAFRGGGAAALVVAICFAAVASAGAVAADISFSRGIRAALPTNLTWIDDAAEGEVTAIATPSTPRRELLDQLYWNQSVQREVILDDAVPTDAFSAPHVRIRPDGRLVGVGRGELLVSDFGTKLLPAGAQLVARARRLSLWRTRGTPRLRLLMENRYWDTWLASRGRIRAWPTVGARAVSMTFRLSLPRAWLRSVVRLQLGRQTFAIRRGSIRNIECATATGPLDLRFSSPDAVFQTDLRALAVRLSHVRVTDTDGLRKTQGCRIVHSRRLG
jgi:hypothetical protein